MKYSLLLFSFFAVLLLSFQFIRLEDPFVYKTIPPKYKINKGSIEITEFVSKKMIGSYYPIIESLPVGYNTEGKKDYTELIQTVLDSHTNVVFPNFPLLINTKGLTLRSNTKVFFEKGSKLILESNNKKSYEILRLHGVSNVELYCPNIYGDRDLHINNGGEWGFGISIRDAQKIKILNAVVKNCWGDGIYLGSLGDKTNSDILVKDCFLDNNRRNGISIISGINITISNSLIANTNGTAPMSGIDIEPNNNSEFLKYISLKKVVTFNNKNEGILIALRALYGKNNKKVSIVIENHLDDSSRSAMGFAFSKSNAHFENVKGDVRISNSVWKGNTSDVIRFHDNNENFVNFKLVHPRIINKDGDFSQNKMEKLKINCRKREKFLIVE
jgi:hypothetical protein